MRSASYLKGLLFTLSAATLIPKAWAAQGNEGMMKDLNMPRGVTPVSHDIFDIHMMAFYVMCGIALVVFGALTWSIIFHRKSRHPHAAQFHENMKLEIAWTIAPFLILVGMAIPTSIVLLKAQNFHHAGLKIKVTGYQWLWQYQYLTPGAKPVYSIYSRLAVATEERDQLTSKKSPWTDRYYLEQVDHPLVIPTHVKILLLITSGDVIHSWWVPDFGGKQDAIPGFINQMRVTVEKPGIYRGVCNQLCGAGHAYMPIVVVAKPKKQFEKWLASKIGAQKAGKVLVSFDGRKARGAEALASNTRR